jgi:hypothetical protein
MVGRKVWWWAGFGVALGGCTGASAPSLPDQPGPDGDDTPGQDDPLWSIAAGDVVFTELLLESLSCPGADGAWVELLNRTPQAFPVEGWTLGDGVRDVPLSGSGFAGGGYTIATQPGGGCQGVLGDLSWPNAAPTLDLGFGPGFRVELKYEGTLIDSVALDEFEGVVGRSWQVEAGSEGFASNDDVDAWCLGADPIGVSDDLGSPGERTPSCGAGADAGAPLTLAELGPGDLVITEVMIAPLACPADVGQWLEIVNVSGRSVDLSDLVLSDGVRTIQPAAGVRVTPGARFVFAAGDASSFCYASQATPQGFYGGLWTWTGAETLSIGHGAPLTVLDEVDLSLLPTTPGRAAALSANRESAGANDDGANWCSSDVLIPTFADAGTPGDPNEVCPPVVVPPTPLGADLAPGALIITEVMFDPMKCTRDSDAEYFEVYNATGVDIDLQGLTIDINNSPTTLSRSYPVPAGAWALAEITTGAQIAACYNGLFHDFLWQSTPMSDDGTSIRLIASNTGAVIDAIDLTGYDVTSGAAMQLDAGHLDALANDDPANWCPASATFPGSGADLGNPKQPNEACPSAPIDTGVVDTDAPPVALPPLQVADLRPGDLVITELIVDPNDCDDFRAEYVEFWNTTGRDVDLTGLDVQVDGGRSTLRSTAELVRADAFGVLRYSTLSPPTCYSLGWNGLYSAAKMGSGGSTVSLIAPAGVIDAVAAVGWGHLPSVSKQLDPAWFDASSNDDPSHWCDSSTVIFGGFSDLGTPGLPNLACGVAADTAVVTDTFVAVETSPPTDTYYTGLAGDAPPAPAPAPVGLRGWLDGWVAWLGL